MATVAAGIQRNLTLVEQRIVERDRVATQSNEDQPPPSCDMLQATRHGLGAAGRVEYHVGELTIRLRQYFDAEARGELPPKFALFDHANHGARSQGKLDDR